MKILLIFILVLVGFIFYYTYPLYKAIRISKKIESEAMAFEQHPQNPQMKILVIGDSTGLGTGASNSSESVAGQLGQKYPDADITNLSKNGLKLKGLLSKLENKDSQYDLMIIQIGANDIVQLTDVNDIETQLQEVLDIASEYSAKTIVLTAGNIGLSPVFKFPISKYLTHRTLEVREIFMRNIDNYEKIEYVDLYLSKEDDFFSKDVNKYYAADRFHPSSEAYEKWFEKIIEKI